MKKFLSFLLFLALLLSGCQFPEDSVSSQSNSSGVLTVHFIDVGQADCALIECDGSFMLVDGGNVADSDLVVSYLQQQGVEKLAAVVCSHAHEDHVGGLPAVLAVFPTESVYSPTRTYSSKCFDDFMYYADQQDLTVEIPQPGDRFALGKADVTVLGPVKDYAEPNNTSLILRIDFGQTRFLFTGDMEKEAETDLLDSGADVRADVLKVGHHGSSTSTSYRFLRDTDPDYAVISCGRGNSYGHPHRETLDILSDGEVSLFRTDQLGTIIAASDGREITFTWENQAADPQQTPPAEDTFIGNRSSGVVHRPTCTSLPMPKNQVIFHSLSLALKEGYRPCSRCMGDLSD